jgi:O-antigen ligase
MLKNRVLLKVYAVLALFTVLAGDFWRYSVSWFGWGAVIALISAFSIVLIVTQRDKWRLNGLPYPLLEFAAITVLSTAWSAYPGFTAIAAVLLILTAVSALALAITFTLAEFLRLLGHALRIIIGGSLLFELVVSAFVRHPILPWWEHYTGKIPASYYWSRDLLFKGDRIQGIMGNSNLFGFVALLAVIVFAIEFASRSMSRGWSGFWLVLAVASIALTRSGTVLIASAAVAFIAVVLIVLRRIRGARGRGLVYGIAAVIVVIVGVIAIVAPTASAHLLGKSGTFTGREGIWKEVIKLASERPVGGWGWISYWYPNIAPFDRRQFVIGHVHYLQAHEAWLDVWLQVGIVGLVLFVALVLSTLVRSWMLAVDRPQIGPSRPIKYSPVTLLPILVLVALLAQSFAESRLLIEYGMLLLSYIAIKSKRPDLPVVS